MRRIENRILDLVDPSSRSMLEYDRARQVVVYHDRVFSSELLDFGIGLDKKTFLTLPSIEDYDFYDSEKNALEAFYNAVGSIIETWLEEEVIADSTKVRKCARVLPIYLD
jgi:hypothetical protein